MSAVKLYLESSPTTHTIFWLSNLNSLTQSGKLSIPLDSLESKDKDVAELEALYYLLLRKKILGDIESGKDIVITVTSSAIKKIHLSKPVKNTHAVHYSRILCTFLDNAKVTVDNQGKWLRKQKSEVSQNETLNITTPYNLVFHSPVMGDFVVTQHAFERFKDRSQCNRPVDAWSSLLKRLTNKALQKVNVPKKIIREKSKKWGDDQVIYKHGSDPMNYVTVDSMVNGKAVKLIVSSYYRNTPVHELALPDDLDAHTPIFVKAKGLNT